MEEKEYLERKRIAKACSRLEWCVIVAISVAAASLGTALGMIIWGLSPLVPFIVCVASVIASISLFRAWETCEGRISGWEGGNK